MFGTEGLSGNDMIEIFGLPTLDPSCFPARPLIGDGIFDYDDAFDSPPDLEDPPQNNEERNVGENGRGNGERREGREELQEEDEDDDDDEEYYDLYDEMNFEEKLNFDLKNLEKDMEASHLDSIKRLLKSTEEKIENVERTYRNITRIAKEMIEIGKSHSEGEPIRLPPLMFDLDVPYLQAPTPEEAELERENYIQYLRFMQFNSENDIEESLQDTLEKLVTMAEKKMAVLAKKKAKLGIKRSPFRKLWNIFFY